MSDPVAVYVAAGSNVEPERHLATAVEELRNRFAPVRFSKPYRNEAVGFAGPDFINFVAGFETRQPVAAVIGELQRIETLCGRTRDAPKWEPRSMDLDILLYGELICTQPGLVLPRPDLLRRPYMLGPLAELAPALVHPTEHRTIAELWAAFSPAAHGLTRCVIAGL